MPNALARVCIAVAGWLLLPALSSAQGLGSLSVSSALGEPLRAEIQILPARTSQDSGLDASIATPDAYRARGKEFNPALFSVRAAVEDRRTGPVVVLSSSQPIREPFLDVLVVLQSASGRLMRDYSILLDAK